MHMMRIEDMGDYMQLYVCFKGRKSLCTHQRPVPPVELGEHSQTNPPVCVNRFRITMTRRWTAGWSDYFRIRHWMVFTMYSLSSPPDRRKVAWRRQTEPTWGNLDFCDRVMLAAAPTLKLAVGEWNWKASTTDSADSTAISATTITLGGCDGCCTHDYGLYAKGATLKGATLLRHWSDSRELQPLQWLKRVAPFKVAPSWWNHPCPFAKLITVTSRWHCRS